MIRATHRTIRDYWQRQDYETKPAARHVLNGKSFRQVIQSAYQKDTRSRRTENQGLTIQDYRHKPVSATRQAPLSVPSDLAEMSSDVQNTVSAKSTPDNQKPTVAASAGEYSTIRRQIDRAVSIAARKYGLSAELVQSVIRHESNYNPEAVSQAGARGLMQLMPGTARELGVTDPFDICQNIDGGSRYLKKMMDQFDGDLRKALAAYNAGPGTVRKYGGVPPFSETRNYVHKVISSAGEVV